MNRLGYIITGVLLMSYGIYMLSKALHIPSPELLSSYFADLLCMPILLIVSALIIRKIPGKIDFLFSWKHLLFAWIYISFAFEWLLPKFRSIYTSDWVDVLIYGIGTCFFYLIQQRIFLAFKSDEESATKPTS